MAERFDVKQISSIVRQMRQDRRDHDERLRRRRLLIEMATEAYIAGNGTGTNIPPPFTKSQLAIQVMLGDIVKAQQQYTAIFTANTPQITVTPIVVNRDTATDRVDQKMGDEERLLNALWEAMGGPQAHKRIGMSQSWGRVGWYFVMPRDQLGGLPERRYYDDLTDAEIEELQATGGLTPEPIEAPDGKRRYAESGESYVHRRTEAARAKAADSMFALSTFSPDVVYAEYDADGVKWAAAVLEVPAYNFGPGSDYAKAHAKLNGKDADIEKWGLYYDRSQNRIVGGVTTGGEPDVHTANRWTYTIFATREEVYCLASNSPDGSGELVWHAEHNGGRCPLVPAPGFLTDSTRPGGEYSSPMEAMFAIAAPFNQAMTLLALATSFNATARWVLVREDGSLVPDPVTGDPKVLVSDTALGLDPTKVEVVSGTPMQLKIDVESLFKLAEFYEAKKDTYMPSAAVVGGEGYSGSTAWGMQQAIEQGLADMKQPVDNHANAVKEVMLLCIVWMRQREETIYAVSLPGKRSDARSVQGLIEFDPKDLVTSINVKQSASTAQSKIVTRAAGQEALTAGTVTLRGFFEQFTDEDDARAAELNIYADRLFQVAAFGTSDAIQPGSVAWDYMLALRGEMSQKLLAIPTVAIRTATDMALNAQSHAAQQQLTMTQQSAGQANLADEMGMGQPGLGGRPTTPPAGANVAPALPAAPVGVA